MIKISRTKIELFVDCPRCFYLDIVKGIKRPRSLPYTLNNAVDTLLKKEFDRHRAFKTQHSIQREYGLNIFPSDHPMLEKWQQSIHHGVIHKDEVLGFHIYGGIDDLWENEVGEYFVVDYKATAKETPIAELPEYANSYRRQMEIYQWLLRKNGLKVSNTAYFVFATGDITALEFNNKLNFTTNLITYEGDDTWVDGTLNEIYQILRAKEIPEANRKCEYCSYNGKLLKLLKSNILIK